MTTSTTEDPRRNDGVAKKTQTYLDILRKRMNSTTTTEGPSTTSGTTTTSKPEEVGKSDHPTAHLRPGKLLSYQLLIIITKLSETLG